MGTFNNRIVFHTEAVLGPSSDTIPGVVSLMRSATWSVEDLSKGNTSVRKVSSSMTVWVLIGVVAVLLVGVVGIVVSRRGKPVQTLSRTAGAGRVDCPSCQRGFKQFCPVRHSEGITPSTRKSLNQFAYIFQCTSAALPVQIGQIAGISRHDEAI